jgi:hypothetical protein
VQLRALLHIPTKPKKAAVILANIAFKAASDELTGNPAYPMAAPSLRRRKNIWITVATLEELLQGTPKAA